MGQEADGNSEQYEQIGQHVHLGRSAKRHCELQRVGWSRQWRSGSTEAGERPMALRELLRRIYLRFPGEDRLAANLGRINQPVLCDFPPAFARRGCRPVRDAVFAVDSATTS